MQPVHRQSIPAGLPTPADALLPGPPLLHAPTSHPAEQQRSAPRAQKSGQPAVQAAAAVVAAAAAAAAGHLGLQPSTLQACHQLGHCCKVAGLSSSSSQSSRLWSQLRGMRMLLCSWQCLKCAAVRRCIRLYFNGLLAPSLFSQ